MSARRFSALEKSRQGTDAVGLRWGFIGCGNLAQALILGAIQKKYLRPAHIFATDRSTTKLKIFAKKNRIQICESNAALVKKCDVIFLVTKPQDITEPLVEIAPCLDESKTVVSLAAGADSKLLKKYLNGAGTLVRVMGNTPAMIQKGFFGIYVFKKGHSARATQNLRALVSLFEALGGVVQVSSDRQIDGVTAASASGVGFVFMLMEQFAAWLERHGFDRADSRRMSVETFSGAAALAQSQADTSLSELREKVTSKKGTTLAGLNAMKKARVAPGLKSGLDAASKRSSAIAKSLLKVQK